MKRAFVIALAIHLCVLLGAGYIYVLPPEKREKLFEMVSIKKPKPAVKKVRIIPPKKVRKPIVRPVKRRVAKPIELIAARTDIVPEFTITLPEASQAVYTPDVALVRLPEPVIAEAGGSFWGKEIEMKEKEIELESFGLQNLQPVGTEENPVNKIIFQVMSYDGDFSVIGTRSVGIAYPEHRELWAHHPQGTIGGPQIEIGLGPYAIRPEEFVFYIQTEKYGIHFSTDSEFCIVTRLSQNIFKYQFEEGDTAGGVGFPGDVVVHVTFLGAQGGF